MDVLLSIKPKFAESIISGKKKYEFRKIIFTKKYIGRVYIYSTSPIKKIVGAFRINDIIVDSPCTLWSQLKDDAGIAEEEFFDYFKNKEIGFALEITDVEKFENPMDPKIIFPDFVPPQSFCYIKFSALYEECNQGNGLHPSE
jgi:type I restriction enzyme S subunit